MSTDKMTGALGFSIADKDASFMIKAIAFFGRLHQREKWWNPFKLGDAKTGHVFVFENKDWIIEADAPRGVTARSPVSKYKGKATRIFRPLFLEAHLKRNLTNLALACCGDKYSFWSIGLFVMDSLVGQNCFFFTRTFRVVATFRVCSQFASWLFFVCPRAKRVKAEVIEAIARSKNDDANYRPLNYIFKDKSWKTDTPDDLMDHCISNPDEWEEVTDYGQEISSLVDT